MVIGDDGCIQMLGIHQMLGSNNETKILSSCSALGFPVLDAQKVRQGLLGLQNLQNSK